MSTLANAARDALSRFRLRGCTSVGRGVRVRGEVWVHGSGSVHVGDGVVLDARMVPIELHAEPGGTLSIGADTLIQGGASLQAVQSVSIGRGCTVGAFCKVMDNHFHRIGGDSRERPPSEPVEVGDGAVLGPRCLLLPGARVAPGERLRGGLLRSGKVRR